MFITNIFSLFLIILYIHVDTFKTVDISAVDAITRPFFFNSSRIFFFIFFAVSRIFFKILANLVFRNTLSVRSNL